MKPIKENSMLEFNNATLTKACIYLAICMYAFIFNKQNQVEFLNTERFNM